MTTYAEDLAANRRLAMLRLMVEDRGVANDSVLEMGLKAMGHHAGMSRQYVRDQLAFLETAGLIRVEYFKDRVAVARITARGGDVVSGSISCEGVAEPGFGD